MPTLPPEVISNIAQRRLTAGNQRTSALQQLGNQYNQNVTSLDQYRNDMQQKINDQMGSQGLFNSGIRMNELGKMQQSVGQKRGYLDTQFAQGKGGIESGYQNALQAINDYQTQALTEQTRQDLAQQQAAAQNAFQQQQAAQAQRNWEVEQWNAAAARNQQAAQPTGPDPAQVQAWYEQAARDEAARILWYTTIANQNQSLKEYRGGVGRVM